MLFMAVAALGALGALYLSRPLPEPTIRVAAAADLQFALDELIEEFQRQHPQITVKVSYGSSGSFFAQLVQRAPFDMFFSADMDYPKRLREQGLALPETEFLYAVGRIVLWGNSETLGIGAVFEPAVQKIALANPQARALRPRG
jgi:molybdate transport system substrate-binding protein